MSRGGTVIVMVMVVMAMATVIAASVIFAVRAEVGACDAVTRGEQAYAAAISGLEKAMAVVAEFGADSSTWFDNPDIFKNQPVYDDGVNRWYFTVYAQNREDDQTVRNGLTDQSGKININTAPAEVLLRLPNMTEELVDCLMDFRDPDSEPRQNGAEQEYYSSLAYPYRANNGMFLTLEVLLLVKGFNGPVVYGEDANLNGMLDPNEDDGQESFPPDDEDGRLNAGLLNVATAVSYGPNVTIDGKPRININGDLEALEEADLPDQTVEFIRLYRDEGGRFACPAQLLNMRYMLQRDHNGDGGGGDGGGRRGGGSGRGGGRPRGTSTGTSSGGREEDSAGLKRGQWIESGVGADELAAVMDQLTTRPPGAPLFGLVNVNTAPPEVLAALPDMDSNLALRITGTRGQLNARTRQTIAWLFSEGLVSQETFVRISTMLTARGYQFHVRCIGFGWPCQRFRIIEAVINIADGAPQIIYQRDITRLGVPLSIDMDKEELTR